MKAESTPEVGATMTSVIAALGHLAVWAGLYVAAAVVCAGQLLGVRVGGGALVFAWSTAVGAYLLDRLKVRAAWLDPADRVAHPTRYAFLERHGPLARTVMAAMWAVSAVAGWRLHPVMLVATVCAAAGVVVYAGLPRRGRSGGCGRGISAPLAPRVKDVFVIKNLFVGAGIAGFAVMVVLVAEVRGAEHIVGALVERLRSRWVLVGLVASHLLLRVFADAVLCDIDDEASDRAHETETLPTRMGGNAAWLIAMWVRLGLAVSLLAWPVGEWRVRAAWAAMTAVSTVGLRMWRPRRVRDVVDARFAVEAVCVWAVAGG